MTIQLVLKMSDLPPHQLKDLSIVTMQSHVPFEPGSIPNFAEAILLGHIILQTHLGLYQRHFCVPEMDALPRLNMSGCVADSSKGMPRYAPVTPAEL